MRFVLKFNGLRLSDDLLGDVEPFTLAPDDDDDPSCFSCDENETLDSAESPLEGDEGFNLANSCNPDLLLNVLTG